MGMPDFLVIGAAKSGTTSLYHYLDQHPDIFMAPVKEPNFFAFEGKEVNFQGPGDDAPYCINDKSITRLDEYRSLFSGAEDAKTIGEASYSSLYVPQAVERINHHLPHAKLIAILRDPAERAHSNFTMLVQQGREPLSDFSTALAQEESRINNGWGPAWHYKQLGFYHRQLRPYYDRFDPDQIKVYLYEDLVKDGHALMKDIFSFLGVDTNFRPDVSTRHNPSGRPASHFLHRLMRTQNPARALARMCTTLEMRKQIARYLQEWNRTPRGPVPQAARRRLQRLYRNDVLALQDLIQRDLSHWLRRT